MSLKSRILEKARLVVESEYGKVKATPIEAFLIMLLIKGAIKPNEVDWNDFEKKYNEGR
jgi:hypothetical protein